MAILDHYQVSLVWQGRGSALALLLQGKSNWSCVYANKESVLYAPNSDASAWHASRVDCPG
jgi:hypothetical protein